jgi:hypothetical protein
MARAQELCYSYSNPSRTRVHHKGPGWLLTHCGTAEVEGEAVAWQVVPMPDPCGGGVLHPVSVLDTAM